MSRRFLYPAIAAAAAIIPGLSAPSAMADTANCTYNGTATTNPPINWGPPVPNSPTNTGTYSFSSLTFTCAGTDTQSTNAAQADTGVAQVVLTSTGNYSNMNCGTGVFVGTAQVQTST